MATPVLRNVWRVALVTMVLSTVVIFVCSSGSDKNQYVPSITAESLYPLSCTSALAQDDVAVIVVCGTITRGDPRAAEFDLRIHDGLTALGKFPRRFVCDTIRVGQTVAVTGIATGVVTAVDVMVPQRLHMRVFRVEPTSGRFCPGDCRATRLALAETVKIAEDTFTLLCDNPVGLPIQLRGDESLLDGVDLDCVIRVSGKLGVTTAVTFHGGMNEDVFPGLQSVLQIDATRVEAGRTRQRQE